MKAHSRPSTLDPRLRLPSLNSQLKGPSTLSTNPRLSTLDSRLSTTLDRLPSLNPQQMTINSQIGLDHEKLTFLFEGRNMRLTDVGGENDVAKQLLS